jgi:arsenate reductase
MAQSVKIYQYEKCSTCRKALKFLEARKITYRAIRIVDTPPSKSELKTMLRHVDGEFKRLFNTSGLEYRAQQLSKKMPTMTSGQAIDLLAKNGRLVKRPFLLSAKTGLVGFNEEVWKKAL